MSNKINEIIMYVGGFLIGGGLATILYQNRIDVLNERIMRKDVLLNNATNALELSAKVIEIQRDHIDELTSPNKTESQQ